MADDDTRADVPRRSAAMGRIDALRASVVVVLFVVALALLLGPASNLVASPGRTTTTTHHLPPVVKSRVIVQVANGTSTVGLANSWEAPLVTLGWDALPGVDASGPHPLHTSIYFKPGEQQAAKLLAAELHVAHRSVTVLTAAVRARVSGAASDDVVIIIGTDHHGEGIRT